MQATMKPTGDVSFCVQRGVPPHTLSFLEILAFALPAWGLDRNVNMWRVKNLPNLWRGLWRILVARFVRVPHFYGQLALTVQRANGERVMLGLASLRVITNAGVNYIAADIAGGANDSNLFKYHGFGTGTNAEAAGDTALQTELTTQYASDSTRPTGSQANSTNTYTTVATLSPDSGGTLAITEHGIFTQAATGGGTLLDRSVFSAVNLVAGSDSLQATYVLTLSAGG